MSTRWGTHVCLFLSCPQTTVESDVYTDSSYVAVASCFDLSIGVRGLCNFDGWDSQRLNPISHSPTT